MQKAVTVEVEVNELPTLLSNNIQELKKHIYIKNERQQQQKDDLKPHVIILHVNYAESYENKHQDEIRSAYFGYTNFSLFTACICGSVKKHSFIIISEANDHLCIAAQLHTKSDR